MKRNNSFILQNLGGEQVLVPLGAQVTKTNGIVIINNTGCYAWELLSEDRSSEDISIAISEQFNIDLDHARIDVQRFFLELSNIGLLQ